MAAGFSQTHVRDGHIVCNRRNVEKGATPIKGVEAFTKRMNAITRERKD